MYKSLTPNIIVNDVNKTINFYTDILKFEVVMSVNRDGQTLTEDHKHHELIWALIQRDDVHIMFQQREYILSEIPDIKMYNSNFNVLFITTDKVQEIYDEIRDKVEIVKDIYETFYNTKEFIIKDTNSAFIFFAQR